MSALMQVERLPVAHNNGISITDIEKISKAISPQLFGLKNQSEVYTLMMLGQADGIHPVTALRRYHIINNKPSMKSETMLALFLEAGGKVKWIQRSDDCVKAEFREDENDKDPVTITWDKARAKKAGLGGNHDKYPTQMMTARCISEGVRIKRPQIVIGIYTPEEVHSFTPSDDFTPPASNDTMPPATNQETWGNAQPPVDAIPPAQIAERIKNLNAWVMDILNCDTFQRTPETMAMDTYKTHIDKYSVGLPADEVRKLKMLAFTQYLTCMITTAPAEELNGKSYVSDKTWDAQIEDYKLPEADKAMLRECLRMNREAMAKAA